MLVQWNGWEDFLEQFAELDRRFNNLDVLRSHSHRLLLHAGACIVERPDGSRRLDAQALAELMDCARYARDSVGETSASEAALYTADMKDRDVAERAVVALARTALEQGEFFHLVQPKYDVTGTRVLGGEALVRWSRPDESIVGPDEFIPLFEQNGFILRLDEFVFESVCRNLRARLDAGLPVVPISVNVSRLHLHRPDFLSTYVRIKDEHGIPDGLCELELTESIVIEDLHGMFDIMEGMRRAGFRCAIDDFGSGQSSLNVLKDLPADVLKLDRDFLLEGSLPGTEETVVRTVITMAKELRMDTVMEGVETPKQLAFLRTTACDMVQGFVFSRPVPPEEFYRLLDENAE